MTFLVIVGTVTVYGLTAAPLARALGVAHPNPQGAVIVGAHRAARDMAEALLQAGFPVVLVDTNRDHLSAARLRGLPTHYGSILAEKIGDELDLSGFGRLLALTPNFGVNSLAALRFTEYFGRSEVYQLAAESEEKERTEENVSQELQGRTLFSSKVSAVFLEQAFRDGAVIKRTQMTEAFDFQSYCEHYGEKAIPLFLVTQAGNLKIFTVDQSVQPQSGDTLMSLVLD